MYVCVATCVTNTHGGQNKVLDFPDTEVADSCELSYMFWVVNLCPLKEQALFFSGTIFAVLTN